MSGYYLPCLGAQKPRSLEAPGLASSRFLKKGGISKCHLIALGFSLAAITRENPCCNRATPCNLQLPPAYTKRCEVVSEVALGGVH